ncbi:2-isopropylmalate synthase [Leeia sp. TBRC 13508]|uniref:2-isopropylmalate synthase n=1 Tax=Leeia speluncae TaxID=2884804 RepID=A0ABS8D444_9NEIS|nr:2-isopropylmalate synthase [Leeia speluncae]MCB6182979.1 2-isopropylmalate synthase [Leeia speluncae]
MNADKYAKFQAMPFTDRNWPNQQIYQAPIWCSTDLRDGNQALANPMSVATKHAFFNLLVKIGFKEIEVAFPSASEIDFQFVRELIEEDRIPSDVTIGAITQARSHLIEKTFEAFKGAKRVIIHLYNPTAPRWREVVYQKTKAEMIDMAVSATAQIKALALANPETEWVFQYSPETFSATEIDFSLAICEAVVACWQPTPAQPMILNLPATVELSTPNHYADQIEWMHRHLANRDAIYLSVHPHNDRGTGVAAAELAVTAGAERIEGCLFGNGERTGNVDLVTLAMNLYSQGIDPKLDFSQIDEIKTAVETFTNLPVHPRHPYAGDLVYTAFSGSHQDAIKKGFAAQAPDQPWSVPYLPIDPKDVGRNYEAVIVVNSQSGKGGIAWVLEQQFHYRLPRAFQAAFAQFVQQESDRTGIAQTPAQIHQLFEQYFRPTSPLLALNPDSAYQFKAHQLEICLIHQSNIVELSSQGSGPLHALLNALNQYFSKDAEIIQYEEHAIERGASANAVCYVELSHPDGKLSQGIGQHEDIVAASFYALLNAFAALIDVKNEEKSKY